MRHLSAPLDPPARLLMGSGPSNAEARVLRAMAAAPVAPDDPAYLPLLDDVSDFIRGLFQTTNPCSLAVAGASRAGIEAVLASTIEPGDRVLVGAYGHFGELLCTLATRHDARLERIDAEWGRAIDPEAIAARIRADEPRVVAIVHADTSTGILQPLTGIGAACREVGATFVVDAVLSIAGSEVDVDGWLVDAAVGGMQKCLGGPPGLALVTCSARARQARQARRTPPRSTYLDLARLESIWLERRDLEQAEMPTPMLLAGREALRMALDESLPARWRRHRQASLALRAGLEAMGLELFGDPAYAAPMITLVRVPPQCEDASVRQQLLEQHGVEIMAAFGPLRGHVWRIGTMGANARLPAVLVLLGALETVLASRGVDLKRGAAVDAAVRASASSDEAGV